MKKNKNNHNDPFLKRLEYKVKGITSNFLSNTSEPFRISSPTQEFCFGESDKILLLRQDRIGDLIISTPFIRNLRKIFPNTQIDIILSEKNYSAKRAVEKYIDNFYIYKKNIFKLLALIISLRKNKYSLIIDLFDNPSTTSSMLIKFINPKNSLGIEKSNSLSYTHIVSLLDKSKFHIVDRVSNLLLAFGNKANQNELNIEFDIKDSERQSALKTIQKNDGDKFIGINLAGSYRAKFWGLDKFIELIKRLNIYYPNYKIVLFATNDYSIEINDIIKNTNSIASPKTDSFVEYASYLSLCDYIISPDTAAVHLASAFQIPCISLHIWTGKKDMGMPWGSYNSKGIMLHTNSNTLSNIPVDDVFAAFKELISK